MRKSFQGVNNIVRFNWHFYLFSIGAALLISAFGFAFPASYFFFINFFSFIIFATVIISLSVSFYIYDLSGLYSLKWLDKAQIKPGPRLINIHAGFDETSALLQAKFPASELKVFDFYDAEKHTEISIKRARKAYPPFAGTHTICTSEIPLNDNYADQIYLILAAHEIRNEEERTGFFRELNRVTNDSGKIIVTEHLRDLPNFLAYNIGFFHFLPESSWQRTFTCAGLKIIKKIKITPFISTYILEKNGIAS